MHTGKAAGSTRTALCMKCRGEQARPGDQLLPLSAAVLQKKTQSKQARLSLRTGSSWCHRPGQCSGSTAACHATVIRPRSGRRSRWC